MASQPAVGRRLLDIYPLAVVVDTPCWFDGPAARMVGQINASGGQARLLRSAARATEGGISLFLSCMRLVPPEVLARQAQSIVVHASALPQGRGYSPLAWQILEGRDEIPVTMIVATPAADAGPILMQRTLRFGGHELNEEMRNAVGDTIIAMCLAYLCGERLYPGTGQKGVPSRYPRRRAEDSRRSRQDDRRTVRSASHRRQRALSRFLRSSRPPLRPQNRAHLGRAALAAPVVPAKAGAPMRWPTNSSLVEIPAFAGMTKKSLGCNAPPCSRACPFAMSY